jgi:hypothetical protein
LGIIAALTGVDLRTQSSTVANPSRFDYRAHGVCY